jgi:hypothetical protein
LQIEVESLLEKLQTRKKQLSSSNQNNFAEQTSLQKEFSTAEVIQGWLVSKIAERLKVNPRDIDIREPFARLSVILIDNRGLFNCH